MLYLQNFVRSDFGLARITVPLFFVISGYLFYLNVPDGIKSVFHKQKKRIRTLLIPYLIACAVIAGIYAVLARFMSSYDIRLLFHEKLYVIVYNIFFATEASKPVAYHLWFLRNLIILVAAAPLWYYALRYLRWGFVVLAFAATFLELPIYVQIKESIFWFVLGGALSKTNVENSMFLRCGQACFCLFVILCVTQLFVDDLSSWDYFSMPFKLLGVAGTWGIYNALVPTTFALASRPKLSAACGYTFFIYLYHIPAITAVQRFILAIVGTGLFGHILCYASTAWVFVLIAIPVGMLFRKHLPKLYGIVTGGR